MLQRLRPQIMVAIILLSTICIIAMLANNGEMKEIAIAGVTGVILLAREVITQDTDSDDSGGSKD
jgi:hypothetical protein